MQNRIKPYYQNNPHINYNIIVEVSGNKYAFDTFGSATEFMQQILTYSVERPNITLVLNICDVEKGD